MPRLAIPGVLSLLAALECDAVLGSHLLVTGHVGSWYTLLRLFPMIVPGGGGPSVGAAGGVSQRGSMVSIPWLAFGLLPEHNRL
jgi:hypothetical protein